MEQYKQNWMKPGYMNSGSSPYKSFSSNNTNYSSLSSKTGGATSPGQYNAQNMSVNKPYGPTQYNMSTVAGPSVGYINVPSKYLNTSTSQSANKPSSQASYTAPAYNPPAVNIQIPDEIPSDVLNNASSGTVSEQKRADRENRVVTSRYAKEEEMLMGEIAKSREFVAKLGATQAREYEDFGLNPEGKLSSNLNSGLNRLSRDQALELNARTGQLNAMLDTLEMYQGYRPSMVGTPQIDETTGEAFAYLQDPMTGEITVESLGKVTEPVAPELVSLSEGQRLVDPRTGEVVSYNPKTYASSGGGTGGVVSGGLGGSSVGGGYKDQIATTGRQAIQNMLSIAESNTGIFGRTAALPIPGVLRSDAFRNYEAQLDSLKGNIIPSVLTAMREASKTGGAVGQVSDREGDWMAASLGALNMSQSSSQVISQLKQIDASLARWQTAVEDAGYNVNDFMPISELSKEL